MKKFTFLLLSVFFMLSSAVAADYENLYVIGSATEIDWSLENAFEMTNEGDGIFTWSGTLMDRGEGDDPRRFKFLTERGWENSLTCRYDVEGNLLINPGEENNLYFFTEGAGYDNSFLVPSTGTYMIRVDISDITDMKMVCVLVDDIPETPDLDQLYIIGAGVSLEGEWEFENPIEMKLVEEGVFTWTGELYHHEEDSEFKFLNEAGTWNKTIVAKDENAEITLGQQYDLYYRPFESSPNNYNFKVLTTGTYTLSVNLNTMKMTVSDGNVGVANTSNTSLYNVIPLKGAINVQADNLIQAVALYDITGKCLVSVANAGNEVTLGDNLTNGVYIIKVVTNNETHSQKVVIK